MIHNRVTFKISISCALGLGLLLGLLILLRTPPTAVRAAHGAAPAISTHPLEPATPVLTAGSVFTVCPGAGCDFETVQAAVDFAAPGDEIRVAAGTYTDISARGGITQVLHIAKSVTVRGGYTTTDWTQPNPISYPTTLDAQGRGRVLTIAGVVTPTIESLRIVGGRASLGGGVYIDGAPAVIKDCEILSNTAQYGGGLYMQASSAELTGNTVMSNTADHEEDVSAGGGLYVDRGAPLLIENTFAANHAQYGGGLYVRRSAATLADNAVVDNQANLGGGICLVESLANLSANVIGGNGATRGAGIYLYAGEDVLTGNSVFANMASRDGGGFYAYNTGDAGRLDANLVHQNSAEYGAGFYIWSGEGALTRNLISHNTAKYGGGVYLRETRAPLDANEITENIADFGGGLYLYYADTRATNNVVARNAADITGHQIRVWGGAPRLLHTTMVGEQVGREGDGSGVSVLKATVEFINTILLRHVIGVFAEEGSIISMEGVLWGSGEWANGVEWTGPGKFAEASSIRAHPAFVDPEAGDYRLRVTSPAVDKGLSAGVSTDKDGRPRPIPAGGRSDLGAYECTGIDLSNSSKTAAPHRVGIGEAMTYTITLLNSGHLSAADFRMHDPIPAATTYVSRSAHATAGQIGDRGSITWTGTLLPQQPVTVTFVVTVHVEESIRNTAFITDAYGTATRVTTWSNGHLFFLPLVLRSD